MSNVNDVFQLGALDFSIFDLYGGTMDNLLVRHNSLVNLHGGDKYTFPDYFCSQDNKHRPSLRR